MPNAFALYFTDTSKSSLGTESFDSIMYVSDNGLMIGNGDGTFTPNANITRAEFIQTLYRQAGGDYEGSECPFSDVHVNDWYYDAVCWAVDCDILMGTSATTFSPNDPLIREQALAFLYRYANALCLDMDYETGLINSHSDYSSIESWAVFPMNWALYNRIVKPSSSTVPLYPKSYCKRNC